MVEDNRADESFGRRIEERDLKSPNPEVRAGYILNLIKNTNNDVTNWDLICFCVEFLGAQIAVYDWLDQDMIRTLTQRVYIAHYTRNDIPETGVKI
jgi:hypothetical protein